MKLFEENQHSVKEVVINQFFALGDLLFIEPICQHYIDRGYKVILPVREEFYWIKEYFPHIDVRLKDQFSLSYETVQQPDDGRLHVPLRFAHPLYRGYDLHYGDDRKNWMRDKYLFLGLDEDLWRTLKWVRNPEKESKLMQDLGIAGAFNLVNENFGSSFQHLPLKVDNGLPNVMLAKVPGYSLLDWAGVIESAHTIHTVETSVIYMIEALKTKAESLHLYPRHPYLPDVDYIKDYMKKENWFFYDDSSFT